MLSVIIPAFRAEKTIVRAIESVRLNSPDAEIVVVIDGPNDPTEAVVRARGGVRLLVNDRNLGNATARNRGLAAVTTEFVTSLDADDYIEGPLHAGMVEAMQRTGADMVFTPWAWERGGHRKKLSVDRIKPIEHDQDALVEDWMGVESYVNGAVGWRTDALRRVGGWKDGMPRGVDYEVGARCLLKGLQTTWSDQGCMVYVHHDSPGRVTTLKWSQAMADSRGLFSMIEKYAATSSRGSAIMKALGYRQYVLASHAYRQGDAPAGDEFLRLARRNGFRGHAGSLPHRLICSLVGLRGKQKLSLTIEPIKRVLKQVA